MTTQTKDLPALPEPDSYCTHADSHEYDVFSADQMRKYALEAIQASATSAPAEWQDIETAPKTSKAILIYCAERENIYTVTWVRNEEFPWSGKWRHVAGDFLTAVATHWQPLPPPPGTTPQPAEGA